jgi:hypothetical protein
MKQKGLISSLLFLFLVLGYEPLFVQGASPCCASRIPAAATSTSSLRHAYSKDASHVHLSKDEPGVHLLHSDEGGVVLELLTPGFHIRQESVEDESCLRIFVEGYGKTDVPGHPRLPVKGAMVGIPARGEVTLTVLDTEAVALIDPYTLCPVPSPIVDRKPSGDFRYQGTALKWDAEAYGKNRFWPETPAELVSTGFIRSQRVAEVRFHPFQVNPVSRDLRHLQRIRVRLNFAQKNSRAEVKHMDLDEGDFEALLKAVLLNYETARLWRTMPQKPETLVNVDIGEQSNYKILVNQDGIYQLTYTDLQATGLPVESLDPRTFQLSNQGSEVAIYVEGESDGSFDNLDYILFYGQKMPTKFTDINVYWLTWGEDSGLRMSTIDGTPGGTETVPTSFQTTLRVEENHLYRSNSSSGPDNDHWYWNSVYAMAPSSPAVGEYAFILQNLSTEPDISATVRGLFKGCSADPQHHTLVYLNNLNNNDYLIDDASWASQAEYPFESVVSQTCLVEGGNKVFVKAPLDGGITQDIFYVNWFEIDYYRTYAAEGNVLFFDGDQAGEWEYHLTGFTTDDLEAFDVTMPSSPIRILNCDISNDTTYTLAFEHSIQAEHCYLALASDQRLSPLSILQDTPSDLRATTNGADYVVITHADFATAVQPLVTHRAARGLRTAVVDVQDVYDEFSYGVFEPEAIREFLEYVYTNWTSPAPSHVLLVGDGQYDFKNNLVYNEANYIPPYLADVDPWMGETAADNRYVCVSGSDIFPDMHIGRLPVKTADQADTMVAKILNYEQGPAGGNWNRKVLFVADDPDIAADFHALSDNILNNFLPGPYKADKVYYGLTHLTSSGANSAVINAINEGRLLVNYIGHSSVNYWAYEHLFNVDDIASLSNNGRLPVMVPMTCQDGYFIHPSPSGSDSSSLGESMVRASGGGAVASWSPAGMGVASGHDFLNQGLYEAIFFDAVKQLGPAATQAKLHLYQETGSYRDLIDTYVLFGDPALELNVPLSFTMPWLMLLLLGD